MNQEPDAGFPSLLHEPIKRFIKYLSVPVASLPAGLIYLFLLKFTTPSIALVVILPIGIFSSYLVWARIDKWATAVMALGKYYRKKGKRRTYYQCPVCGYNRMREPPQSWYICPCCGTEFENNDDEVSHSELRSQWVDKGLPWFSRAQKPPRDWNAHQQLYSLELPKELRLSTRRIGRKSRS